jgi:chromosomal replication initiator protein
MTPLWQACLDQLEKETPAKQFSTFVKPLHVKMQENALILLAPNPFVKSWIKDKFLKRIEKIVADVNKTGQPVRVLLEIGSYQTPENLLIQVDYKKDNPKDEGQLFFYERSRLNPVFTFENFVTGKSNELAKAACTQVAENPGSAYNPLLLYGGVGLGKTHLMHAIGNFIYQKNPKAKILYVHSAGFVAHMVKALQTNTMDSFKSFYDSLDLLLIDDIQFLAGKERSQQEFFDVFNKLFENKQHIVLTSDRYPKEIDKLEDRLKSRFGWGLPVFIEPPELETRVAILKTKAHQINLELSNEVAFFIAKRVPSNVRELEGALRRVVANSNFTGKPISVDFARETLKDLISIQAKLITLENILRTVSEYYKIKLTDLVSANRSRTFTRPRQIAMALAKELTEHSLPEIGVGVGGRDHTTVLYACRKIKELIDKHRDIATDYENLLRILSS